jgi:integrase
LELDIVVGENPALAFSPMWGFCLEFPMALPHVYVIKKPNGVWCCRWRENGEHRKESLCTGQKGKAQAEAFKAKLLAKFVSQADEQQGLPGKKKRPTWDECRLALEDAMRADNCREPTIQDYLLNFDQFQTAFAAVPSPADLTLAEVNEYKRDRAKVVATSTLGGDLTTLHAIFGKWLKTECNLMSHNPFDGVRKPKADETQPRIVADSELRALLAWFDEEWSGWKLPLTYLRVLAVVGWRATETASLRDDDLLGDGNLRVKAHTSKGRREKFGWLPPQLARDLEACLADGWAFGRFSEELRRQLVRKGTPHHSARVKDFTPKRLVGWMQDQLQASQGEGENRFTLHDFRRTAATGFLDKGVTAEDTGRTLGVSPIVMRKFYENRQLQVVSRRAIKQRLGLPVDDEKIADNKFLDILLYGEEQRLIVKLA